VGFDLEQQLSLGWEAEGQRAGFCTETEGSALGLLKLPD